MKLLFISLLTLVLGSCAKKIEVNNFRMHMFSDDVSFIERNIRCDATYKTDKYNVINNEIFRCSNKDGSVFFEVVSDGPNSEDIKQVKLTWKQWFDEISPKKNQITARQYAAVFANLYLSEKEIEFVDSFFSDMPADFTNLVYEVQVRNSVKEFYHLRTATVKFNSAK